MVKWINLTKINVFMVILNINAKCLVFFFFCLSLINWFSPHSVRISAETDLLLFGITIPIYKAHWNTLFGPTYPRKYNVQPFTSYIIPTFSSALYDFLLKLKIIENNFYLDSKWMLVIYLSFLYFILHPFPIYSNCM